MKHHIFQKSVTERNEVVDAYLKEITKIPMLTPEEEKTICAVLNNKGDERVRRRLVNGNLRFVVSVAKQYQGSGLELMDLINEGNVGLVKASQFFDPKKEIKFISFAVWWIRQAIMESLKEKGRLVRLPLNQINIQKKISRQMDQIMKEQGFTSAELAAGMLGLDADKYKTQSSISLSTPMGEEDDFTLADTLSDGTLSDASVVKLSFLRQISAVLKTLDERENLVISYTFGINGKGYKSRFEIANELGVSEERIEQIFHKGIRKLKASRRADILRPYIS